MNYVFLDALPRDWLVLSTTNGAELSCRILFHTKVETAA
jgi:hypothetical protein